MGALLSSTFDRLGEKGVAPVTKRHQQIQLLAREANEALALCGQLAELSAMKRCQRFERARLVALGNTGLGVAEGRRTDVVDVEPVAHQAEDPSWRGGEGERHTVVQEGGSRRVGDCSETPRHLEPRCISGLDLSAGRPELGLGFVGPQTIEHGLRPGYLDLREQGFRLRGLSRGLPLGKHGGGEQGCTANARDDSQDSPCGLTGRA
jgi:hypothetical protein